jgi:hypothetical protein
LKNDLNPYRPASSSVGRPDPGCLVVPVGLQLVVGVVVVEVLAVVEVVLSDFVERFVVEVFREIAQTSQYLVLVGG